MPDQRAREAFEHGDWSAALGRLTATRDKRTLSLVELDMLARAAYASGRFEDAITAWEQCHTEHVLVGDAAAAAAAAATISVHLMMDTGLMAPVRGWLHRAERLMEGLPESATSAVVAVVHTYERFLCGDMDASRRWAHDAIALGTRQAVPMAAALGRVAAARIVILDGDVDTGLALLDDAAVSVVSGELDPLAAGMVYCELICAMQGLAQYDRAEQWTEAMDRWRVGTAFGGIHGRCRVHRAEILGLRGSCAEAEQEALGACAELRPWMRREFGWPLTVLGTIRLRKGDLDGAEEAFLEAHATGWEPQPGFALLRLSQGDVAAAEALLDEAIEHPAGVPSKERPPYGELRRAPLLEARVRISLAAGDVATAAAAAGELSAIAGTYRSQALQAAASLSLGRVALAQGDAAAAARACQAAVDAWSDVGAPYETSLSRLSLAQAHRALGAADLAELELRVAHRVLDEIGAAVPPGEVDPGPPARTGRRHRPALSRSVFRRDGDTRCIEFAGHGVVLCDLKGMRYLARLLAAPARELHVLDLVASELAGAGLRGNDDLGPALDPQARAAYKRRLTEIESDIDEATCAGDEPRVALAEADRDYLVRELSRAFGLSGRPRQNGTASERARAAATRSVRYAMSRICEHHPALAEHLRVTVHTGTYFSYVPDPRLPITWEL